jgi:hypothetical protein
MAMDIRIGGSTDLGGTALPTRRAGARGVWLGAPVVALVPGSERRVIEIARTLAVDVEFVRGLEQLAARVESACPPTIIVDGDVLGWPASFCLFARSLRPDVAIVVVLHHWSEREMSVREWVDAVLHKPPRLHEWALLLRAAAA